MPTVQDLVTMFKSLALLPETTINKLSTQGTETIIASMATALAPEFSKDSPQAIYVTGAWGGEAISLDGWTPGYSAVTKVECPVGYHPPRTISAADYELDEQGALWLSTAATGQQYRVSYTAPHLVTQDALTVPAETQGAYCLLVASRLSLAIAAYHGESIRSDISADSVDHQSKVDQYRRLADAYLARYRAALGLAEKEVAGAFEVEIGFDTPSDRIFGTEAIWPVL